MNLKYCDWCEDNITGKPHDKIHKVMLWDDARKVHYFDVCAGCFGLFHNNDMERLIIRMSGR